MITTSAKISYPLSPMQRGMLFQCLEGQQPGAYIPQIIGRLHGDLNGNSFERAWQRVVERHCVLRTRIVWDGLHEPLQEVASEVELSMEVSDWRHLTQTKQRDGIEVYLKKDRIQGFQLSEAPLMRVHLFRLGDADYQFVWTCHHIILDRHSMTLVLREVFAFYEAFCPGQTPQLEQPHPYREYIYWLQEQDNSGAENFWREALQGFTEPTPFRMLAANSEQGANEAYGEKVIFVPSTLVSALRLIAESNQVTLSTIVHGAWALLLSRLSGKEDVLFGVTRGCRSNFPQAESMVGLFVNTVPLRVRALPDQPLLLWLRELRKQLHAIRAYEHAPLSKVQVWSEVPRGVPLFNTLLTYDHTLNLTVKTQDEVWRNRDFGGLTQTSCPLTLRAYAESDLTLKLDYDGKWFNSESASQILDRFRATLEGMLRRPNDCLGMLRMLSQSEQQQAALKEMEHQENERKKLRNTKRRAVDPIARE